MNGHERTLGAAVLVAFLSASAPLVASAQSPAPSASPAGLTGGSPAPVADPAITARAKNWLHRVQTGDIDRAQLNATVSSQLTDALVKSVAAQFGPLGDPKAFTLVDKRTVSGNSVYEYRCTFASSSLFWVFALDGAGKISGLRFLPAT